MLLGTRGFKCKGEAVDGKASKNVGLLTRLTEREADDLRARKKAGEKLYVRLSDPKAHQDLYLVTGQVGEHSDWHMWPVAVGTKEDAEQLVAELDQLQESGKYAGAMNLDTGRSGYEQYVDYRADSIRTLGKLGEALAGKVVREYPSPPVMKLEASDPLEWCPGCGWCGKSSELVENEEYLDCPECGLPFEGVELVMVKLSTKVELSATEDPLYIGCGDDGS